MTSEKQSVALSSMAASALMTIGKFTIGLMTGSLGLVSEGLHSLLDFGATIMTYMAVRVSDKPADDKHPYGHGKIESIAALAETILLFITSFWIIYEAGHRLLAGDYHVETTLWSVGVIVASILIDLSRARALKRVAQKTRSQALEADALHFSSDVLSSTVVLLGLGLVWLGWPEGDALAAIGVSIFVCHAGWVMGRRTIDTLIDTAPDGAMNRIKTILTGVEGVSNINRVRLRPAGSLFFVDADIAVGRSLSQARVDAIKHQAIEAIQAAMPEAEVSISTHPLALSSETVLQRVMVIAANHDANVHHVTSHRSNGRLFVGFDLEVDGEEALQKAHAKASHLEADMRSEFGEETEVETHIEPLQDRGIEGGEVEDNVREEIVSLIEKNVMETTSLHTVHDVRVRKVQQGLLVVFHCLTDPSHTVADVHDWVDSLERRIRAMHPGIWRIVAHAEPEQEEDINP